jgi:raffinose/stachyose/melibiose transport system permease protein
MKEKLHRDIPYFLFVLPALIVYTVLTIAPLIQTLALSFTNYNGYSLENLKYVGFENFKKIFSDRSVRNIMRNTILYAAVNPFFITLIAIPLALALNMGMKTRNFQRAVFFFPSVPSILVLGYLWAYILAPTNSGLLNNFLGFFGMKPVLWLAKPNLAMISIIGVSVWGGAGWHACIYLARLQGIPRDFYEAATIDGAGPWQRFRFITFPMLASAMTISVMLLVLGALKVYDLPFALTKGGPGTSTTMVSQLIIKTGFTEKTYAKAMAMSTVFFVFISIVSVIQLTLMKKREVGIDG